MIVMKNLTIMLTALMHMFEGNTISFSGMLYYQDSTILSLLSSFSVVIQRLSFQDLLSMMKLCHAMFSFLKVIVTENILVVSNLPPALFQYFMNLLFQGISCDARHCRIVIIHIHAIHGLKWKEIG